MPRDPRTPVVVGAGQINQRDADIPVEPVELMARAARRATGPRVLEAVDAIRVVNLLSWRYRDPGLLLGQRIGAKDYTTRYSHVGGNVPQSLLNQACRDIQSGRAEVVLLAGAETWRTRARLRAEGGEQSWTMQPDSVAMAAMTGEDLPMAGPAETRIELVRPANVYPLFEQALRVQAAEAPDDHRRRIGELWSQFSAVAANNPHAWNQTAYSADDIWRPGPQNRMISWPYPKLMNANNAVDQGAVVVVASAAAARRLGIDSERWVFPYAGTDAHDTYAIGERADFHRSPAIRIAGSTALHLAGYGIDDVDLVDLYSCFPCAVQIAAAELGLPVGDPGRPLTVTGGLTFAGGPWNNYTMHSIATMWEALMRRAGAVGLVTANGGYLTKHSIGVYGIEPPTTEFRWKDVQPEVDREPTREGRTEWEGAGTIEAWTAPFNRDGNPEKAFVAVRTPGGARTFAVMKDPSDVKAAVSEDLAGQPIRVGADGSAVLAS